MGTDCLLQSRDWQLGISGRLLSCISVFTARFVWIQCQHCKHNVDVVFKLVAQQKRFGRVADTGQCQCMFMHVFGTAVLERFRMHGWVDGFYSWIWKDMSQVTWNRNGTLACNHQMHESCPKYSELPISVVSMDPCPWRIVSNLHTVSQLLYRNTV